MTTTDLFLAGWQVRTMSTDMRSRSRNFLSLLPFFFLLKCGKHISRYPQWAAPGWTLERRRRVLQRWQICREDCASFLLADLVFGISRTCISPNSSASGAIPTCTASLEAAESRAGWRGTEEAQEGWHRVWAKDLVERACRHRHHRIGSTPSGSWLRVLSPKAHAHVALPSARNTKQASIIFYFWGWSLIPNARPWP